MPNRAKRMSPDAIAAVQASFRSVSANTDVVSDQFYSRLFERLPDSRDLFPDDMSRQRRMLIGMLNAAVANLHHLESIQGAIQDLGARHIDYGVSDEQYDVMGEVLLDTLADLMGDAFDAELRAAWAQTYGLVVAEMRAGMATPRAAGEPI